MRIRIVLFLSFLSLSPLLLLGAQRLPWPFSLFVNFIPQASLGLFLIGLAFFLKRSRHILPLAFLPFAGSLLGILILQINTPLMERSPLGQSRDILSILQFNLQYNEKGMTRFFKDIEKVNPDVIVLTELPLSFRSPDISSSLEKMRSALPIEIAKTYPWLTQSETDSLTRTLILSRFEIINDEAFSKNIARARIRHSNGVEINIFGIHPPPPLRPLWAFRRDRMIANAFRLAASSQVASLVVGDYNAVPWSRSISNPARQYKMGRSERNIFKNTWLMPWGPIGLPIDHLYGTKEFHVINKKTLSHRGSDHLPIYTELVITP